MTGFTEFVWSNPHVYVLFDMKDGRSVIGGLITLRDAAEDPSLTFAPACLLPRP